MTAATEEGIPTLQDEAFRKESFVPNHEAEASGSASYLSIARRPQADLLTYLIEFGDQPIVLRGPEGVGKSTIVEQQIERAGSSWRVCRILARSDLLAPALLVQIAHQFDMTLQDDYVDAAIRQLGQMFALFGRQGYRSLLLIDDAELLPVESIQLLVALFDVSARQGDGVALVLVVNEGSGQPGVGYFASLPVVSLEVAPFSLEDTGGYISYLAEKTGQPAWQGLEPETIAGIYRQSAGLPSRVNALLHQPHLRMHFKPAKSSGSGWLWLMLLLAAAAAVIAMLMLG